MVLKEWAEVWNLYKAGHWRLPKALLAPNKRSPQWSLWATTLLCFLLISMAVWGRVTGRDVVALVGLCLTLLFLWPLSVLRERAFAKEFEVEYEKHGLAGYPLLTRPLYLRYALFLRGLAEQARSHDDITKLRRFTETAVNPDPALRLAQHPAVVPLVTVLTVLTIELFKQSAIWQSKNGWIILFDLCGILLAVVLVVVVARIPKHKHQEFQRFLQWAEMDTEEKKSNQGMEPTR